MILEIELALSASISPNCFQDWAGGFPPSFFDGRTVRGGQIAVCQQFGSCFDQFRVEIQRKMKTSCCCTFPKTGGWSDTADLGRQRLKGSWLLIPVGRRKIIHPEKTIGHFVGAVNYPSGLGFQAQFHSFLPISWGELYQ